MLLLKFGIYKDKYIVGGIVFYRHISSFKLILSILMSLKHIVYFIS